MRLYPYTPSQVSTASVADLLAFIKSPTLVARRMSEILSAQQFIGNFLLSARYTVQGGAIAIPKNEQIRTQRRATTVAPGAEYQLTAMTPEEYELYTSAKEGIATEVTDEEIGRSLRQPIEDALLHLQTELVFDANDIALGVITSSITRELAASASWATGDNRGKTIYRDALRAKAQTRKQKMGYDLDTVVLDGEAYAEVLPELLDVMPKDSELVLTDGFPTVAGLTWIPADGAEFANPIALDRRRLGGIARENIPSPEYRDVGGDTGVQIAPIRMPTGDKTRLQARNPHVPVITNPLAAVEITGTGV